MKKKKSDTLKCSVESGDSGLGLSLVGDRDKPRISIKKISNAVVSNPMSDRQPFVVYGQMTMTDLPVKSTGKDLETKSLLKRISGKSKPKKYLTMNSLQEDFPVSLFPLLENAEVFKTSQRELFSSKSVLLLELKDHATYSLRMLKDYFLMTKAEPSQLYSFHWMNLGMMWSGRCSTLSIGCPRTGKGSLSLVLEERVSEKYYISETMLKKIIEKKDAHPGIKWKSGLQGEGKVPFPDNPSKPSRTITTGESGANRMTHGILVSREGIIKKIDTAHAICESDYRGLNRNSEQNAILEEEKVIKRVGGLFDKEGKKAQAGSVYNPEGISPILDTAQGGHREPLIPDFARIRRLTPKECERLQGFPDDWTKGVSDTQRYKQMGNAVSVPVIVAIGKAIIRIVPKW